MGRLHRSAAARGEHRQLLLSPRSRERQYPMHRAPLPLKPWARALQARQKRISLHRLALRVPHRHNNLRCRLGSKRRLELQGNFLERLAFPFVLEEQVLKATGPEVINVTAAMVRAKIDQMLHRVQGRMRNRASNGTPRGPWSISTEQPVGWCVWFEVLPSSTTDAPRNRIQKK